MKYQAALFDLDGTLLDTLEDLNLSMQHTLEKFGLPTCTYEQTRQRVGNGIVRLVERSLPEGYSQELFDAVYQEFVSYYALHADDHTKPYPGVLDLLARLRESGCKIAVVSNKNHAPVCALVKKHFGDAFDVVLGVQGSIARKPAPDMVYAALAQLALSEEGSSESDRLAAKGNELRAIYIGDSEVDIATAKNAGLPCVSVTWGFRTTDELTAAGAEVLVDSAPELADFLLA